jgi:hypothetical protein
MKINQSRVSCASALIGSTVLPLMIVPFCRAQSAEENIGTFSFLGQLNKAVTYENNVAVGPVACVPTAVANGLYFLQHNAAMEGQPDPFKEDAGTYDAVNTLAALMGTSYRVFINPDPPPRYSMSGGTPIVSSALGLMKYMSATGQNPAPTISVTGQYSKAAEVWLGTGFGEPAFVDNFSKATPTAAYLANALNANSAVEIGIQFGNYGGISAVDFNPTGGHEMTLYGIDFNPMTDKGTIDFLDPFAENAFTVQGKLSLSGGYLDVQYDSPDGKTIYGRIVDDMVEKINANGNGNGGGNVPDGGATSCLLAGTLLGVAGLRRCFWRDIRAMTG